MIRDLGVGSAGDQPMADVVVVRSPKRRKTVQARLVGGVVHVSIPARMSRAEEERWVAEMVGRFQRKRATEPIDLAARAEVLAARYGLPQPTSIRWVDNQEWRWGSCTPADRSIRLSTRLGGFPPWVVDYVIVHELAHLVVGGHGRDFWALVERYPRCERARGFLIAKGLDGEDEAPPRPATKMQDPMARPAKPAAAPTPSPTLF
ncbi:MAG TPA: M48 family metallopeptidase [Acidimicrobiales bacterium]|nr:M48 family metallopeptidase [Acidimicrobiales bacterium]